MKPKTLDTTESSTVDHVHDEEREVVEIELIDDCLQVEEEYLEEKPTGSQSERDVECSGELKNDLNESEEVDGGCISRTNKEENTNQEKEGDRNFKHTQYDPVPVNDRKTVVYKNVPQTGVYQTTSFFPRGRISIFSIVKYKEGTVLNRNGKGEQDRDGGDADANVLCDLFRNLGFQVDRYDNPTRKQILDEIEKLVVSDFSQMGCCATFFLSHGEAEGIHATDKLVRFEDITTPFRTEQLAGKPKMFFFNACRGPFYMGDLQSDSPDDNKGTLKLNLPTEADFLYSYATVLNFRSWRNSLYGSWFVNDIVAVFREYAHKLDINHLLTLVNEKICERSAQNSGDKKSPPKCQVSSFVNQLRLRFFFFPPNGSISKR